MRSLMCPVARMGPYFRPSPKPPASMLRRWGVRRTEEASRRSVPQAGHTEGEQNREGHLMADHVHMMISIPPKYAVSQVVGYIKGKSAIHLARVYGERKRNFVGQHFWARGYFVSTAGRDEAVIREYIRK